MDSTNLSTTTNTNLITTPLHVTPTTVKEQVGYRFLKTKKHHKKQHKYNEYNKYNEYKELEKCNPKIIKEKKKHDNIPQNLDSVMVLLKNAGYDPVKVYQKHNESKDVIDTPKREYFLSEESCSTMCNTYSKYITVTNIILLIVLVFLISNLRE